MRPGDNQPYVFRQPVDAGGDLESGANSPVLTTVPTEQQPVPKGPQTLLRMNKWAIVATATVLILIIGAGVVTLWLAGFKANNQSRQPANDFSAGNLALNSDTTDPLLNVTQATKLNINGELQVGSTFILTPTNTPTSPKTGQIYYDKNSNTAFIYNGTSFVSMVDAPAVESIAGASGILTLGNGLQLAGGQLSVSSALQQSVGARVTTIQGQSGDVSLLGGTGIVVNGTTITNTGVVQVLVNNGLSLAQTNGTVTIGLPQLLGMTNMPTFQTVQLSNALSIASGGTNTNGNLFATSGVFYYDGSSFATTAAAATDGLCLVSSPTGPAFSSCSGTASVTSLNGANGALILDNATANTTTGHITINDASTAAKGIAQFSNGDFSVAGGVVSLLGTITKAGNSFNGSEQLIKLDTNGQALSTGQCLQSTVTGVAFSACPGGGNISSGTAQTSGRLTKFDVTTNTITNSIANEAGSTINVTGTVAATLLQGDGSGISALDATNIATGTLLVARGGTGAGSFTANGVLIGNSTSAVGATAAGTSGQCLVANTGLAPTFQTCTGAGGVSSIQGTLNQITASSSTGSVTLSLEQNINTGANVQFASATLSGASALTLGQSSASTGAILFRNGVNSFTTTLLSGTPAANLSFTLPSADGTTGQCLTTNASGGLGFSDCLSGGSGGSGGVSSLRGGTSGLAISGALVINNAASSGTSITLDDATSAAKGIASFNIADFSVASGAVSLQNTVTKAGNAFNGASQLVQLDPSGFLPTLNGSQLTALDATNITTGTLLVPRGGTGAGSFTANGVLIGNGTSAVGATAAGTSGQCLVANTGLAPTFQTCTGAGGVSSLNAMTGAITIQNGTGIGLSLGAGTIQLSNSGVTSLTGTVNRVTVSATTGGITLDLPQDINNGANVQFAAATLTGANALSLGQSGANTGAILFRNGVNSFTTTLLSGTPAAGLSFTLPSADGSANQCLKTNASGVLSFGDCLSGASGGSSGVTSLQGGTSGTAISGALTISNATSGAATITLDRASATALGIASFNIADFSVASGAVSLGTVSATKGGTGLTSYTTGDLLYASSATTIGKLAAVASGSCLLSAGTSTSPAWGTCLTGMGSYSTTNTDVRGASLSSGNLILQSASTTAPGMVDTGAQTFAGNKTFTGNTTISNSNLVVQNAATQSILAVNATTAVLTVGQTNSTDTFTKLADPASLPSDVGYDTSWSPDGAYLSVAQQSTPFITIYKRSGDTFTKLPNPASLPAGASFETSWSPDGTYMSVAHSTTPFITIYKRSGDTFTKLPNPATLPAGSGNGVSWSPDGTYMSVAHSTTPFITIYKRSGDTFTKLPNPATLPAGNAGGAAWSPDGVYMTVANTGATPITIYKRSGDTFTKLPNPATLPPVSGSLEVTFSPDGTYMSVAHSTTPFITIYKRSGDTFTKLPNPATLPTGSGDNLAFSPDGTYLSVAHDSSPFVTVYKISSGDTFTKLPNPATLPTGTGYGVSFSPSGQYMAVAHAITPFLTIYRIGDGQKVDVAVNGTLTGSNATFSALTVNSTSLLQGNLTVYGGSNFHSGISVQGGGNIAGDFTLTNSTGLDTLLTADTTNNRIVIGNATGTGTATTALVLDTGIAATPPTGVVGAMYYDTTSNQFMCYTGGTTPGWGNCSKGVSIATGSGTTAGVIAKFDGAGNLVDSNLAESGTTNKTLTYTGNAVINAATGFTGNLLDLKLNSISKLSVTEAGNTTIAGTLGVVGVTTLSGQLNANGGIVTNNQNITVGTATVAGANINATTALQLGGADINTAGTLTNVAYKNASNIFTGQTNTFNSTTATTQNALEVNANNLTTGSALKVATASAAITGGSLLEVSQNSAYASTFSSSNKLLNVSRNVTGPSTQPTLETTADGGGTGPLATSLSWTHTVGSGSNRALIVTLYTAAGSPSVTYTVGATVQTMTQIAAISTDAPARKLSQWILVAPTTGTGTIAVTAGTGYIFGGSSSWTNVHQTTPYGTPASAYKAAFTTSQTLAVTATASQRVVDAFSFNDPTATPGMPSPGIGQTLVFSSNGMIGSSYKTGASSMSWSWFSNADSAMIATPINAASLGLTDGTLSGSVANIASTCAGCTETGSILSLQQSNTLATGAVLSLQNSGLGADIQLSSGILRNSIDTVAALSVQNSAGTETLFKADTTNNRIVIGNATGTGTATTALVLDTGIAATPPTGVVGAMYYDTTSNQFMCYTGGTTPGWGNCSKGVSIATGSGTTAGVIAKFDGAGNLVDSNLAESGTTNKTLTYTGNAVINAATGFTGNLLDLKLNSISKLSVTEAGNVTAGTFNGLTVSSTAITGTGALTVSAGGTNQNLTLQGTGTGIVAVTGNLTASTGTITGANVNATTALQLNGANINTAGTLTNVAYENQDNTFTGITNSFNSLATTQYALAVNSDSATTGGALQVSTTSSQLLSGNFIDVSQASQYANNYSTSNTLLNIARTVGTQDITATIGQVGTVSSGFSTSSATAGQQYFTFSHTVPATGSNKVLFVALATCYNTMTITYNGLAMTKYPTTGTNTTGSSCNGSDTGGFGTVAYYYLVNPPVGTFTVAVTTGSANAQYAGAIAMTFSNVNQATPINNAAAGNPATINVRSYEVGLDVYLGTAGGAFNPVPGGSQILEGTVIGGGPFRMGASKTPVSGTTISQMSWTPINTSIWDHLAIRLNPAVIPGVGSASGNLVNFTNTCNAGTCGDTTTLLSLSQTVAQSTGSVLNIQNAGTGYGLQVGGNSSLFSGSASGYNTLNAATIYVGKDATTGRSINAAGSVNTTGSDYAEWIPWSGTKPEPGSVITHKGSTFIVSSMATAGIVGNDGSDTENSILVAFTGQLPVRVTGSVHEGDLLVNNGDGTARAIPQAEASFADYSTKVGVAWETNEAAGVKKILAAVGTSASAIAGASALQGTGNFSQLNVSGNVAIGGDLTVVGLTTVQNLVVNGHFITAGDAPIVSALAALGAAGTVSINGNDVAGTLTFTTDSSGLVAGDIVSIAFAKQYQAVPRVIMYGQDAASVGAAVYPTGKSLTGFALHTNSALSPQTTYTFDYFISQ